MIDLRAHDDVDERGTLDQELALGLGDTAGDRDQHVTTGGTTRVAGLPQPAELGIDLLGRLLTDMTGIQDDEVGLVGTVGRPETVAGQRMRHTIGIVHVHLAAVGADMNFLHLPTVACPLVPYTDKR